MMKNIVEKIRQTQTYTLIIRLVFSIFIMISTIYLFTRFEEKSFLALGGLWYTIHMFIIGFIIVTREELPIGINNNLLEGESAQGIGWILMISSAMIFIFILAGVQ